MQLRCGPRARMVMPWLLAGLLAACSPRGPAPGASGPPPVEVGAVAVAAADAPVTFEYVARTESSRLVEIRARIDGYLEKRFYQEGTIVQAGAPLFQIDPGQQGAMLQSARAQVQQSESRLLNTQQTVRRLRPLLADEAVSPKDLDDALAAETAAAAALESTRADLQRAQMQLSYTRLSAPFTGLAGKAMVAEGSYINPGLNGLLTTVAQLDPIHVTFSISENDWLGFAEEMQRGTLRFPREFEVRLVLPTGQVLPTVGRLNFSTQTVDPQTGSYTIRAAFANSSLLLRPGQIVRVRLHGAIRPAALLVPQRAVMQGQRGKFVYVVAAGDKAEMRPVEVGDWLGDQWVVTSGLRAGDRVVVDGMVRVQPGAVVKVTAPAAPAGPAAPAAPAAAASAPAAAASR